MTDIQSLPPEVKRKNGVVQALTCEFERTDNGNKVILLGILHWGSPEFYEAVSKIVEENRDASILREGIWREENTSLEAGERKVAQSFNIYGIIVRSLIKILRLKLIPQEEGLVLPDDRIKNIDFSVQALTKHIREAGYVFPEGKTRAMIEYFRFMLRGNRTIQEVLVELRESHLIEYITQETEQGDVLIPWGVTHVDTLGRKLQEIGLYKLIPESQKYLNVYRIQVQVKPFLAYHDLFFGIGKRIRRFLDGVHGKR